MKFLSLIIIAALFIACNNDKQTAASTSSTTPRETTYEQGAHLFKINCSQCHMPAKDFAAPALAGVEKRWADKKLLYEFVKNSQAVIKKDKYAADLFEKWKQAPMLPFEYLSDAEIDAIFEYCNQAAAGQ